MLSKIKATWAELHASDKQTPVQSKEADAQTRVHINKEMMPQSKPSIHHYSITVDGEQFEVDIPDMVKSVFTEELRNSEEANQTNVLKVATLLFAGYLDAATSMSSSCGGGGSPGDGWGKDKNEDERNWAIRCAKMTKWLCKPIKRGRSR